MERVQSTRSWKELQPYTNCHFCNHNIGLLESYYIVRTATKPPSTPYRWKVIGKACEDCQEVHTISIDPFNN